MIHSYPFYIADWRGSEAVMSMTVEERGLYRELLDHCWETGSLPADETILRKIAQATEREWRRSWPKVRQQFTEHDGRLWHPKVDAKRPGLEEWHRSRREAGRAGGLKRWGKFDDGSASSLATGSASSSVSGSATSKPVAVLKPSSSSSSTSIQNPPTPLFLEASTDEKQTTPDSPSVVRSASLSPLEVLIQETAQRIHDRHPAIRTCGIGKVTKNLRAILKHEQIPVEKRTERIAEIEANHKAWCATEKWTKDGDEGPGSFSNGLGNWLAPTKGRFNEPPPDNRQWLKVEGDPLATRGGYRDLDEYNKRLRQGTA